MTHNFLNLDWSNSRSLGISCLELKDDEIDEGMMVKFLSLRMRIGMC